MSKLRLKNSEHKGSIGDRFRAKRFLFFEHHLNSLNKPVSVLDVGGTESFWINRELNDDPNIQITLLNLEKKKVNSSNMISVAGNATDLSLYKDKEFDIVFSNSVIEHLYTFDNQKRMAEECQRVGKYFFVQTPNKYFFIEPHFRLPFFNHLPKWLAKIILTKTKLSLNQKWSESNAEEILKEIRLLSRSEFEGLFPNSSTYTEKFFFSSKSFTVHNFE